MLKTCVNERLEEALCESIGKDYNAEIGSEVVEAVHTSLVESLEVDDDEILPESRLVRDLGAESIDGLDITYKIERCLGIRVDGWENLLLIPEKDDEYTQQTALGLARLVYDKKVG